MASEGQGEAKEEFRPPLLGLGADPQKQGKVKFNLNSEWCIMFTGWDFGALFGSQHHAVQALSAAMKVERRLAQRIKGSSAAAGVKASDTSRKHGDHLGCTCHLWKQCRPLDPASCHVRCWEPSIYIS